MLNKEYGMKWLTVYTVLFVIQIIGSVLSTISTVMACAEYNLFSDPVGLSALALVVVETAYRIFTFIHFYKRTALGYILNMVYIFLDVFIAAMNTSYSRSLDANTNIGHVWGVLIALAVLLLVWSLPNYIYFKHRKFLFDGKPSQNIVPQNSQNAVMTAEETPVAAANAIKSKNLENPDSISVNKTKNIEDAKDEVVKINLKEELEGVIPVEDLRALKELYDSGILTKDEFDEKKKQLLDL